MNYHLLMAKITEKQETREELAKFLNLHPHTLYMKMRPDSDKQQFTQAEIKKIAMKYDLTADEIQKIFFN